MYKLSEKAIAAIEEYLNKGGRKELVLKIENEKIVVLKTDRKRIA